MRKKLAALPVFLALLSLTWCLHSCRTPGPTPTQGGPIAAVAADCLADPVRDLATHLLDDVASALVVSGDWREALKAVAVRAGGDGLSAVKCAAEHLMADAEKKLTARARMDEATADRQEMIRERAGAWLVEHPSQ